MHWREEELKSIGETYGMCVRACVLACVRKREAGY